MRECNVGPAYSKLEIVIYIYIYTFECVLNYDTNIVNSPISLSVTVDASRAWNE